MTFPAETLAFLQDLRANNDRAWFTASKARYETAVARPSAAAAGQLREDLAAATGLPHRAKVFRIHRDLRFSRDPTPYHTRVHISVFPDTGAETPPAWLLGLAPDYFALGCGVMAFGKPALARFRERAAGPEGAAIAARLAALAGDGVRLSEPELKRVPPPWPRDHPQAALLRRKGLVGWIDAAPEAGIGADGRRHVLAGVGRLRPLFDLLLEV